jgi:TetR/AcrR family transcriptional regulator, transcriptional repressor of aconitase
MSEQRMTAEERKSAIVKAVLPLFARKGFARTTTKELAEAAGVSEALLYKHFPGKESLYAAIQDLGCKECDPELDRLLALEPCTKTLVYIVHYVMRGHLLGRVREPECWESRQRMIVNSCLEDGSFARFLFHNRFAEKIAKIAACMERATEEGEMIPAPVSHENRLLFTHHLATMMAALQLPVEPVVDYGVSREELVHHATWYALRGIGLTEGAIVQYLNPNAIAEFFSDAAEEFAELEGAPA